MRIQIVKPTLIGQSVFMYGQTLDCADDKAADLIKRGLATQIDIACTPKTSKPKAPKKKGK